MLAKTVEHGKLSQRNALGDITNQLTVRDISIKGDRKGLLESTCTLEANRPFILKKKPSKAPTHLPSESFSDPRLIDDAQLNEVDRKRRRNWIDVDALNHDDPQACSHYAPSIMEYLRQAELTRRANPTYFEQQPELFSKMRIILIDWLVEVSEEFKLCCDTLFQSVNYFDRYLTAKKVSRNQLQLVGVTCMWVASKFEEIYPPTVSEFSYITDYTYPKEDLIKMEEDVLQNLKYELAVPTPKTFLRRLLQVCNPDDQLHYLSNYLTEVSLMDHAFLSFLPSQIAAAAVYLSHLMLNRPPWSGTLEHYSCYTLYDFAECLEVLNYILILTYNRAIRGEFFALFDKYANEKYLSVSRMMPISHDRLVQHLTYAVNVDFTENY